MKQMVELNLYSVSENKEELIQDLKDLIWKLEIGCSSKHKLPFKEDRIKLNYGCRSVSIKETKVSEKFQDWITCLDK